MGKKSQKQNKLHKDFYSEHHQDALGLESTFQQNRIEEYEYPALVNGNVTALKF